MEQIDTLPGEIGTGDVGSNVAIESSEPSVLLKLPNEIWSLVFTFVPFEDCVQHRLVSKWWRKNVDELSAVHINRITDYMTVPVLKRIFRLRVRSCGISNLRNPFDPNFEFPLLVKEITFGTNISSENMLKILTACLNVENLSFFTTISSDISFSPKVEVFQLLNKLKSLKSIEIVIHNFAARSPTITSPTFETLIGSDSVKFPALSKLSLTYTMYHSEWIKLFNFVSRHTSTLSSISMKCQCAKSQSDMDGLNLTMANIIGIGTRSKLTELSLKSFTVQNDKSLCNCKIDEVWKTILTTQASLEIVSTDLIPKLPFILELVSRNVNTLKSVSFYDVLLELGDVLDGSIFSQCKYLEVLQLQFIPAYVVTVDIHEVGKKPKLNNFDFTGLSLLPKSLVRLYLHGCEMQSSDLLEISVRLSKLKELQCGSPGISICSNTTTGVTYEVFKSICTNLPKLCTLKLHNDVLNMNAGSECGSEQYCTSMFPKWNNIVDTAKSTEVLVNANDDRVPWRCTDIYEFNFSSATKQIFVDSLKDLENQLTISNSTNLQDVTGDAT